MCFVNSFVSVSPVSLRIGVLYHSHFFALLLLLLIRSITTIEELRAPPGCLVFVLPATLLLSSRCCADCGFVSVARLRCEFGKLGSRSLVLFLLLLHRFSAGYLFAINRSDLHPDDTLETRKGDKRWKRSMHNWISIQISVQSVRIIIGILSLRL